MLQGYGAICRLRSSGARRSNDLATASRSRRSPPHYPQRCPEVWGYAFAHNWRASRKGVLELPHILGCRGFSVRIKAILPANPKAERQRHTVHSGDSGSFVMSAHPCRSNWPGWRVPVGRLTVQWPRPSGQAMAYSCDCGGCGLDLLTTAICEREGPPTEGKTSPQAKARFFGRSCLSVVGVFYRLRGSRIVNSLYLSTSLATAILPPCCCVTMS